MHSLAEGGDAELLAKATAAGEWLLRIQQPDGDLTGSVYNSDDGNVTIGSNFAGTACAILLWSDLFKTTGNVTWLVAAERAADLVRGKWMVAGSYRFCGGELDDLFNPRGSCSDVDTTAVMYGCMAFASLTEAAEKGGAQHVALRAKALRATRVMADYMLVQQEVRDTNYGFYRRKARWMGADFKTVGGFQEWIRPETTFFMWRAYQATGDAAYLQSMLAHARWMQYKQWGSTTRCFCVCMTLPL